jgi:hypothetical protein
MAWVWLVADSRSNFIYLGKPGLEV